MSAQRDPGGREEPTLPLQDSKLFQLACDAFSDPIFVKDRRHRWVAGNAAFFRLLGKPAGEVLGKSDPDFFPPDQVDAFWRHDDALFESGQPSQNEECLTDAEGTQRTIWTRKQPLRDEHGQIIALSGIITDVTEIQRQLAVAARLATAVEEQERLIQSQQELLGHLAVPVIQIWESVLLIPVVGQINEPRGRQILDSLLAGVTRCRARIVLLDITGVPEINLQVARYLLQSVEAARLLGCTSILVGIAASVAAEIIRLGVDFSRLTTRSTLQEGLRDALSRLHLTVTRT